MSEYIIVFVTVPERSEAEKIASVILEKRLCACVNIVPGLKSMFHWQGNIDNTDELLLIIKTKSDLFMDLARQIKELHSYTVPELIALPIVAGSKEYLDWMEQELSKK